MEVNGNESRGKVFHDSRNKKPPLNTETPLKVNTQIAKETVNGSFPSPILPSFHRTKTSSNRRQSWVFNKPPPIPETESMVCPRPILEKNGLSAKSRLSILYQKRSVSGTGRTVSSIFTKPVELDKPTDNQDNNDLTSSLTTEEMSSDAEKILTESNDGILSSSPTAGLSSITRPFSSSPSSDYDALSDSMDSLSPSATSISAYTTNRDSMSDITSTLSISPITSSNLLNGSQNMRQSANGSNKPLSSQPPKNFSHRNSMPSTSNSPSHNSSTQSDSPRRASMPIILNKDFDSSNPLSPTSVTSDEPLTTHTTFENNADHKNISKKTQPNHLRRASSYSSDDGSSNVTAVRSSMSSTSTASLIHARLSIRGSIRMSMSTLMQKRQSIAWEILTTERYYVDCLLLVERLFLKPLLNSLSTLNPIITKKSINDIFSNLLDLVGLNTELLRRLEERIMGSMECGEDVSSWNPENGCLGDIFLNMGPFFKIYSIYVKNFNSALAAIDVQLRESPAFSAFLRDIIKTGQCKGLTLQAYLIMPVQRIPRYKLLLEDLLKKTEEDHVDYLNLKKAYQVIENVAAFVNETIRQHEMFITMLEIQNSLTGFDEVLLVPARTFIKRGTVKKVCRRNHQERDFFLFSDILIYASPGFVDNMYNFHHKFDLEDVTVVSLEDFGTLKNGFQIMSPVKSFTLYTDTLKEKMSWINAIRETKEEYLSAKRTLRIDNDVQLEREDSYKKRVVENYNAPVWIPDTSADKCMNCSEEFNIFFRRKHHCRACGKVICHGCSTRNFIIPGPSERDDKIARACDPCFFTMFPDALRDEDLAPGIHVWNIPGYSNNTIITDPSPQDNEENGSTNTAYIEESTPSLAFTESGKEVGILESLKSVHAAILAKQCELCKLDFNVFRWRNVCLKCKKIVCTGCLTKKPIDLALLPREFILEMLSEQQTPLNPCDSTIDNGIRLCDVCYLGIDPKRVIVNEDGGGWTVSGQFSPPSSPLSENEEDGELERERHRVHKLKKKGCFDHRDVITNLEIFETTGSPSVT